MSEEYSDKPRKENKAGIIAGLTAGGIAVTALCFFAGTQFPGGNITNNRGEGRPDEPNQQMSRPDKTNRGDRRGGSDKKDVPNEKNISDKKDNQGDQGGPGGQSESRRQGGPGNSSQAGPDRQNR